MRRLVKKFQMQGRIGAGAHALRCWILTRGRDPVSYRRDRYGAGTELILSPPVHVRILAVARTQQMDSFTSLLKPGIGVSVGERRVPEAAAPVIVVAAGGTGGHLYPGVALAHEFRRRRPDARIVFVGTARGLEARVVPQEGFDLELIEVQGVIGRRRWEQLRALARVPAAVWRSLVLLRRLQPRVVIGVGGYASGPVLLAARLRGLPTVLVEPNAIPGWTNRLLAPLARRVFVAFERTRVALKRPDAEVVGNPVRREIAGAAEEPAVPESGGRMTVLIMGGSQGARAINRALVAALAQLPTAMEVSWLHQTGPADLEMVRNAYAAHGIRADVVPFIADMAAAYRRADLVVCRAGATTLAELTACGRPAILIPYPFATHGHQEWNANELMRAGAAEVILEPELTGARLAQRIGALLSDSARRTAMALASRALGRPYAAAAIVDRCMEWVV